MSFVLLSFGTWIAAAASCKVLFAISSSLKHEYLLLCTHTQTG